MNLGQDWQNTCAPDSDFPLVSWTSFIGTQPWEWIFTRSMAGTSQVAQRERIFLRCRRHGLDPWVGKIPWRRKWHPTPLFLPGKSHGQRSLAGCSPWGRKRGRQDLATKQQQRLFWCHMEVATETIWPTELKIFTVIFLMGKVCWSLNYTFSMYLLFLLLSLV